MSVAAVIAALKIPPEACVDQRVPKKLLAEQGAPTTADKRQIQDGIEELLWVAALKPTNIGVQEYRDEKREYLEIAVLTAALRNDSKVSRLIELIHRAIPYPVFLVSTQAGDISISLAHKRFSEGQGGKMVLEEVYKVILCRLDSPLSNEADFFANIALSALPSRDLFALYQGWIDCFAALEVARITGSYPQPTSPEQAEILQAAVETYARMQREISGLRTQAAREKQLNRRVELNIRIKRLEAELAKVISNIATGD